MFLSPYIRNHIAVFTAVSWIICSAISLDDCDDGTDKVTSCSAVSHFRNNLMENFGVSVCLPRRDNVTSKPIVLCSDSNSTAVVTPRNLRGTRCFCDSKCHAYHDCCLDKTKPEDKNNADKWACRELNSGITPMSIYMIQLCPADSHSSMLLSLCENEALTLKENGRYYNHLQSVPVHSEKTGFIYRNIYCAMCNYDSDNLTKWKTYINCSGQKDYINPHANDSFINFSKNATYDPKNNRWSVYIENRRKFCRLIISEFIFEEWDILSRKYNARLCKPAISTCSPLTSIQLQSDCKAYSSFVYKARSPSRVKVYKNYHCALCNNVSDVDCDDPYIPRIQTPESPKDGAWLPLLFDFNFVDGNDDGIGIISHCQLTNNQIWDPLLRICLNMSCGSLFRLEGDECIPVKTDGNFTNSVIESDCRKVILTKDRFVVIEDGNIYVNYSQKMYSRGQYEMHKTENGILTEILICEYGELQFEFPSSQIWLSEFTIGLSVTCLLLHIIIYSLLPTLRNRPGKILMSLSTAIICAHLCFLFESYCRTIFWLCYIDGVLTYYGYLSSFFWMSIMAYDIHRTFSATGRKTSSHDNRTFMKYSLYSWLSSLIVVILSLGTNSIFPNSLISPKFGNKLCFFNSKRGLLLFFGLPIAILLLCNLSLFVITAISIRKVARQTKMVSNFSEQKRYFLYVKLGIVLGLTWIFGFLAAFTKVEALWYPFIILNGLQGTLIFIVFTVKKKIMHMLIVKLKIKSHKYSVDQKSKTKAFYRSLSNLTTLQTTLTSSIAPAASGSPDMLVAVRQINSSANICP